MELDRYQQNSKLFIIGIMCLVLCLALLFFSLFILPFLIWGLHYEVPDFITYFISVLEDYHDFSYAGSRWAVGLLFFIPSLISGFIAFYISNKIDNDLLGLTPKKDEIEEEKISIRRRNDLSDSATLAFKILLLILGVIALVVIIQLVIPFTAPA